MQRLTRLSYSQRLIPSLLYTKKNKTVLYRNLQLVTLSEIVACQVKIRLFYIKNSKY